MTRKTVTLLLAVSFLLSSCEKNINFDLKDSEDVLVVDASIENNQPPLVVLTRSTSFFNTVDPALLLNSFVHDADVFISNGSRTHQMKEYATQVSPTVTVYSYGLNIADPATSFFGALDTKYTLTIRSNGKEYTASTTIPPLAKKIDSIWWKKAPYSDDTSNVVLMARTTDPPGLGNYIRYFTQRNSGPFLPGDNSVFDDQVIDNTTYDSQVDPGIDRNFPIKFDSNYFKRGDTITLKLCNIDKQTYTFWSTWEFAFQSIGNPFAQPNKVLGNISNGALGDFYGYAAFYRTLIVPK